MPKIDHNILYNNAYKKYGINPKALCWNSSFSQKIRFQQIYDLLPKDLSRSILVDCGCGFGDFYLYLQQQNNLPKHYIGVEEHQKFAQIAFKKTKQTIITQNYLSCFVYGDYSICSGTLNTLHKFESYLFISKMAQMSKKGIIFNFLMGKKKTKIYNYFTLKELKQLLQKNNYTIKTIRYGYYDHDCTLLALRHHQL